ncbi:Thiamine biosynthesis lipoprotein ApbE precursor [Pirellulimonas nuda]|uniref:FAD:protein FMN transferase n=1 Tax=Pirellulimonas nuda TaxID=2528009 RepID=A0A518DEX0_9BACT|nr:FAD:protein FMN transferase [Pirellulimonas nuda]QDU90013.1 Thiamine biosynthesis lipoprotein ApbE precursor [Pirellulimonas nuda]
MTPSAFIGVHPRLFLACVVCFTLGCDGFFRAEVYKLSGPTMGTRYNVSVVLPADGNAAEVARLQSLVDGLLKTVNDQMSTYQADSELSRFNAQQGTDWFEVSPETAAVVQLALEVAEQTQGAFDPTVGPVVNLWGFGPDGRRDAPPTDAQIAAALARVGYRKVEARSEPPALKKSAPDVYLDLSAIAKGYGSDAVSELLLGEGVGSSMVEIGGEVRTRGAKPDGSPWRIGVEKPDSEGRTVEAVVELRDGALATSGDYRNFFEEGGKRYSHTIDPKTGRPVTHTLATVSVRTPTCAEADALATGLLVMGPRAGYDWCEQNEVAALFIERTDEGFRERATTAWTAAIDQTTSK